MGLGETGRGFGGTVMGLGGTGRGFRGSGIHWEGTGRGIGGSGRDWERLEGDLGAPGCTGMNWEVLGDTARASGGAGRGMGCTGGQWEGLGGGWGALGWTGMNWDGVTENPGIKPRHSTVVLTGSILYGSAGCTGDNSTQRAHPMPLPCSLYRSKYTYSSDYISPSFHSQISPFP